MYLLKKEKKIETNSSSKLNHLQFDKQNVIHEIESFITKVKSTKNWCWSDEHKLWYMGWADIEMWVLSLDLWLI